MVENGIRMLRIRLERLEFGIQIQLEWLEMAFESRLEWLELAFECFKTRSNSWKWHLNASNTVRMVGIGI